MGDYELERLAAEAFLYGIALVFDFQEVARSAREGIGTWRLRLRSREHIMRGLAAFPEAPLVLYDGMNTGKLMLKLA